MKRVKGSCRSDFGRVLIGAEGRVCFSRGGETLLAEETGVRVIGFEKRLRRFASGSSAGPGRLRGMVGRGMRTSLVPLRCGMMRGGSRLVSGPVRME